MFEEKNINPRRRTALVLILLVFLQYFFRRFLPVFGVAPDFFLIWILLLTLKGETVGSLVWAVILGLVDDLLGRNVIGKGTFGLVIAGYLAAFFRNLQLRENIYLRSLYVFGFSILYIFIRIFNWSSFDWNAKMFFQTSLIFGMYNVIMAQILFLLKDKLMKWTA